ncbi:SEFIR domain-containing protein [Amycolatopsis sp. NPDC098790]|uniref:SEFIR domain-containing protein n=1 Tax=Amycolatopsis sp. NPDC098790 TaxID=3363939 RepID=UPI0038005EA9
MGDERVELAGSDNRTVPRVFVTYSHDSPEHKELVLRFCTFLRAEAGLDVHVDRWYEDVRRDWSLWAIEQLAVADFVLVIASPGYRRRVDGWAAPDEGRGAQFEGAIIRDNLTRDLPSETRRVLPVVLPGRSISEIPAFLHGHSTSHYVIPAFTLDGAAELLAVIAGVARHPWPARGRYVGARSSPGGSGLVPWPALLTRARDGGTKVLSVVTGLAVLSGMAGLTWSGRDEAAVGGWTLTALAAGVLLAVLTWRRLDSGRPGSLDELAVAVRAQWRVEERLRRLQDPAPMQPRWNVAGRELQDHEANIGIPHRNDAGRLDDVADLFLHVPSGRLVVVGEPGAGKTVLALRLTLALLERRGTGDPVPVLLSLASWDPRREGLRDWLAARLVSDYAWLGWSGRFARELVETGRVLPVLDGLDEMPGAVRTAAIRRINAGLHPGDRIVLTCRRAEYAAVVEQADVLTAALVLELQPLVVEEVAGYLVRTARVPSVPGAPGKWDAVLDYLRAGAEPRALELLSVLGLPLMTSLARSAYSDTTADPIELVVDHRLARATDVADHLVGQFIPAVYDDLLGDHRWTAERAGRWLGFLATLIEGADGVGFAWWELCRAVPRVVEGAVGVLAGGLAAGLLVGSVSGAVPGLLAGVAGGAVSGVVSLSGPPLPSTVRLRARGPDPVRRPMLFRTPPVGWLAAGAVLAGALWFAAGPFGLALGGFAIALAFWLDAWFDVPADVRDAVGPHSILRADRTAALTRGAARGVVISAAVAPIVPLPTTIGFALAALVVSVAYTSWGRFVVARGWFALTGRLPWRLMEFLDDAHRRGVLRQAGSVHEFRHAILRERLRTRAGTRSKRDRTLHCRSAGGAAGTGRRHP